MMVGFDAGAMNMSNPMCWRCRVNIVSGSVGGRYAYLFDFETLYLGHWQTVAGEDPAGLLVHPASKMFQRKQRSVNGGRTFSLLCQLAQKVARIDRHSFRSCGWNATF